jgi:hypothetical protein
MCGTGGNSGGGGRCNRASVARQCGAPNFSSIDFLNLGKKKKERKKDPRYHANFSMHAKVVGLDGLSV